MGIFSSALKMKHQGTPATPPSGVSAIYFKTDGGLYAKGSNGTERAILSATQTLPKMTIISRTINEELTRNYTVVNPGQTLNAWSWSGIVTPANVEMISVNITCHADSSGNAAGYVRLYMQGPTATFVKVAGHRVHNDGATRASLGTSFSVLAAPSEFGLGTGSVLNLFVQVVPDGAGSAFTIHPAGGTVTFLRNQ